MINIMEAKDNRRGFERVMFKKAYSMSNSFSCQICVVGFISGVCLTSMFLVGLSSFVRFDFDSVQFHHHISSAVLPWNSSFSDRAPISNIEVESSAVPKVVKIEVNTKERRKSYDEEKVFSLFAAWSSLLNQTGDAKSRFKRPSVPNPPHLEDCKTKAELNKRLDTRLGKDMFPPWTLWKGSLDACSSKSTDGILHGFRQHEISEGANPPWVTGSDDENYPLTRKVQRDLWLHQHPVNCRDPKVKFLVADFERDLGLGLGAQISGMIAVFSLALSENRVLVTKYYNRADHDGCKGASRGSWSCYFLPETSQECRDRATELMSQKKAWLTGIIKSKNEYKNIWRADPPRNWGTPWSYLQPTTEINGTFFAFHRGMDRRWWLAQAVRYLMRFPNEYMCHLTNLARHAAFGKEAAELVLASYNGEWSQADVKEPTSEIERYVWANHRPWLPRPLLSVHVRMGDKACEMKVVAFDGYMTLANKIRQKFPNLKNIWLSTEMEEVVTATTNYDGWNFYLSDVKRQVGNITMRSYETSLGRRTSTENPLVNFFMASEADYYIGALGSTWCNLIDGIRNTGGKVMSGYLSVNKDRHW